MNCTHAREHIADLDRSGAPGPELAAHLRDCPACRAVAERLQAIDVALRETLGATPRTMAGAVKQQPDPAAARFTARVMAAVVGEQDASAPAGHAPALGSWSAVGTIIVGGMVAIQFSAVVEWLRIEIGTVLDVALGTLFGVALTIYILFLVGSNMTSVQRLLRLRSR